MKNWIRWTLLFLPFLSEAGGFQVNTQGQKAIGMGGSLTGMALDASVCFFNPGGLAALDTNYFNAGVALLIPKSTFLGNTGLKESMSSQLYTPFHVYGSYKLKEKIVVGLSVNTPFGLGTKWEDNWSGRYVSQSVRLTSIYFQPTIAYKINDHFSVGAGPVLSLGHAHLEKALPVAGEDGTEGAVELDGTGSGFGFNAGVYAVYGNSSFGINYRSKVKIDLNGGDASFNNIPASLISNGTFPATSSFNSGLTLPSVFSVGIAHVFNETIKVNLDVNYTGWNVYDSLIFDFPDHTDLNSHSPKEYKSSMAVRAGLQYQYSDRLQLRGGAGYDQSPVQDGYLNPDLPDADKSLLTAGCSYKWKKGLTIEASFMFENVKERKESKNIENNFNGTYKTYVYVAGLGIQYQF